METIAMYFEPVIQVYGFDLRSNLSLLEIGIAPGQCDTWSAILDSTESEDHSFVLAMLQLVDQDNVLISLVLDKENSEWAKQHFLSSRGKQDSKSTRLHESVDLLFFHGPHFQDRYGIAEALLSHLDPQQIHVHALGCTGTSIYLVTGPGQAALAREMLADAFTVPGE